MVVSGDYERGFESVNGDCFIDLLVSSAPSTELSKGVVAGVEALLSSRHVPQAPFGVSLSEILEVNNASFVDGLRRRSPRISRKPASAVAVADGRRKITPYLTGFLISQVIGEGYVVREGIPGDDDAYNAFMSGRRGDNCPVLKESGSVECVILSKNESDRRYQLLDEKAFCAGRALYLIGSYGLAPEWVVERFAELRHPQSWRSFQNIIEGRYSLAEVSCAAEPFRTVEGNVIAQLKELSTAGRRLGLEARKIRLFRTVHPSPHYTPVPVPVEKLSA